MHCYFRFLFFNVFFALCAVLIWGCGKKAVPYDSLRGEILADLSTALTDKNSAEILKALNRLEPLTHDSEFVFRLREKEHTRSMIIQLNNYLEKGEIKQARDYLNSQPVSKSNLEFQTIDRKITALESLRDYLAVQPYADSEHAREAFEHMRQKTRLFASYPLFKKWLADQAAMISRRQTKEREIELNARLDACDQALDTRAVDTDVRFARLVAFSSTNLASRLQISLRDGDPRLALALLSASKPMSDLALKSLEICLLGNQSNLSPVTFKAILALFPNRPPQSLAGHVLRIIRMADDKKPAETLLAFRQYIEAGGGNNEERLRNLCSKAIFPPAYFNARPWRLTCPTTDSILGIFTQWHDFHAESASGE